MTRPRRTTRVTKGQEYIRLQRQVNETLARLSKNNRAYVVFPKHLLIAARRS